VLRIVDSKRIDLTEDEFAMYEQICNSYKQGRSLFSDLFETNSDGIIICLKPPKKMFSMEVVCFLQNVMVHQHLRRIYKEHNDAMKEIEEKISEINDLKNALQKSSES
jgi:hypothetical protein